MVGKKNIVFGFLFLVLTAGLGGYMSLELVPGVGEALEIKQTQIGRLQALKADDFEEELEPLTPEAIAKANTDGLLALNRLYNAQQPIDMIKGGPHAHGNLESLLNIVVGITLCFVAVSLRFKQAISWIFIVGTLFHSGSMYLMVVFEWEWASLLLNSGIGPGLILLGLLLIGIACAKGFRGEVVKDAV